MGSFSPLDVDPPLDWNVTGIPQTDAYCPSFIPGKLSRSPESPVGVVLRRSSNTESAPSAPIITCLGFYREKFCLAHPCTVRAETRWVSGQAGWSWAAGKAFWMEYFSFILWPCFLHPPPCSLTPGHTALKLAGGPRASAGLGAFAGGWALLGLCQGLC